MVAHSGDFGAEYWPVEGQQIDTQWRLENEMKLLSAQLLTAREMERRRIASELHDSIGQSLNAIKFSMESAISRCEKARHHRHDDQGIDVIKGLIPKMQGAIDEVRRISMDLYPAMLDDLGIVPAIAWFCREFSSIYSQIQLDTHIDVEEEDLSAPVKTAIYRIVQEALNNVVRHAQAEHAQVHLRRRDSVVELLIRDDGVGANAEVLARCRGKGVGIIGMRERAELSGGTFFIISNHGAGTLVCVSWPCLR